MTVNRTETAKKFLAKELEKLSEQERQQQIEMLDQLLSEDLQDTASKRAV